MAGDGLSGAQVVKQFLEGDAPVSVGGKPFKGMPMGCTPMEQLQFKKGCTQAEIDHAAACMGLSRREDGKYI